MRLELIEQPANERLNVPVANRRSALEDLEKEENITVWRNNMLLAEIDAYLDSPRIDV